MKEQKVLANRRCKVKQKGNLEQKNTITEKKILNSVHGLNNMRTKEESINWTVNDRNYPIWTIQKKVEKKKRKR